MPKCIKCGTDFEDTRCPACGETPRASLKALNKHIQKRWYLLLAGLVGVIIGDHLYPPLDEHPLLILGLGLFFLPVLMQIVLIVRKRLRSNVDRVRRVYDYSGSILILLAAFLIVNGIADRAPVRQVQTSITRKYVTSGRYTTNYHLVVSPWRPGEDHVTLRVGRNVYHAMFVGEPVVVEVHAGLFGLPWYSRVSPA
jgi:hypothetical protein